MVLSDAAPKTAPMDKEKKGLENRALFHQIGHVLGLLHEHTPAEDTITFNKDSVMLYGLNEKDEPTQFNSSPSVLDKALLGVCFASFSWKFFLLRTYQAMYPAPGNLASLGSFFFVQRVVLETRRHFCYQVLPDFAVKIGNLQSLINSCLEGLT